MKNSLDINKIPKSAFSFLWYFLKPIQYYVLGVCSIIFAVSTVYVFDGILIRALTNKLTSGNLEGLYWFAVYYFVFWESLNWCWRGCDYFRMKIYPYLFVTVTEKMMEYMTLHSHQYYQNNFAGSISTKISDSAKGVEQIFNFLIFSALRKFLMLTLPILLVLSINVWAGLIVFLWTASFILLSIKFSYPLEEKSAKFAESRSTLIGKVVDTITNISNVRLFARRDFEGKYLSKYSKKSFEAVVEVAWMELKVNYLKGICNSIGIGALIYCLLYLYEAQVLNLGDLMLIITVCMGMTMETWTLSEEIGQYNSYKGTMQQALKVLLVEHQLKDAEGAKELVVNKGEIKFDKVTFRYRKNNNLFSNKTVVIKPGEKVGLVGYSGSGKSTFVNLITRFFDVDGGRILIDGQDISKVTQDSLRESISFIPQDPSLFHRTLMENVKYGKPDATEKEVIAAAKNAHAHEFILQTEKGYSSLVGERGIKLSGGQRQRIAIARAMLKASPILILDEATSSLDSVTENLIQDSLKKLMDGKTTIVIAHRLSTLLEMDRILVFDKGTIVEDGSHKILLRKKSMYHHLWHSQVGGFLPDSDKEEVL